ncbi:hypothetical protein OJF2_48280 [Aquisphaera giovannonii]|uniref:Uncharacterized protein n=1 Tax=Aquisphaera giovannonii TaxID=406548 RepID=A0A5B9W6T8_9BACT|nr:hypothetical protein [Aquisphaera giovannonii]QEH36268.1 hypothetical protein OJF2_48280 [Aquisphaera giovannonii]
MATTRLRIQPPKACGKRRHYSKDSALGEVARLCRYDQAYRPSAPPVNVYRCTTCQAYHVGHASC